jgi:hypothetical protein
MSSAGTVAMDSGLYLAGHKAVRMVGTLKEAVEKGREEKRYAAL